MCVAAGACSGWICGSPEEFEKKKNKKKEKEKIHGRGIYYQSLYCSNLKMDADDRLWRHQWIGDTCADQRDI